jgi:putative transposase
MRNPFRYYKTLAEVILVAVMMTIRFPLSLRQVEDLLHECGIDISYETVRAWWNRFEPLFAGEIRKKRPASMRLSPHWRWHLGEVFVRINGVTQLPSGAQWTTKEKSLNHLSRRNAIERQPSSF